MEKNLGLEIFPERVVEPEEGAVAQSVLKDIEIKNISRLVSGLANTDTDDLSEIMSKHKSDKGWGLYSEYIKNPGYLPPNAVCHNYTHFYNYLFCNHRNESIQIFEMGVGVPPCMGIGSWGGSLKGWKEYFPNSVVFSADFDKDYLYNEDGIQSFYVDQEDANSIKNLWLNDEIKERTFDLIVDDGPHTYSSNYLFFVNSFKKLKTGGIFIIEDINLDFIDFLFDEVKKFCEDSKIEIEIEKVIIPWPSTFSHNSAKILNMNNLIFVKKI
jgi:hypothetical protein